jgi:hypothetical protein
MAGLGLPFHKSARALAPRGLLRSAYVFLCLIYTKSARASWNVPGQFWPTPELHAKNVFWAPQRGFDDAILYKSKINFCRLTIQEPIFSVSNTEFKGGGDGRGHGDRIFLVK